MDADARQMPPPAARPQKRKRMSSTSLRSSVTSNGSDFPESVKLETRRLAGDQCWICTATPADVCHVFAKGNRLLEPLLRSRGLLNFDLTSTDNAIALCPTCHANFDDASDPGFFFVPADLDYFIQYERDEYLRRIQDARNGVKTPRVCPDASMYQQHQGATGTVQDQLSGGLYQRIFLRLYTPSIPSDQTNTPKAWHGNPLAAIRRGIMATGTMRVDRFPQETFRRLRELQELYARPDPEPEFADSRTDVTAGVCQVYENAVDTTMHCPSAYGHPGNHLSHTTAQAAHGVPERLASSSWVLGPNLSTQDVLRRYQHLLRDSDTLT